LQCMHAAMAVIGFLSNYYGSLKRAIMYMYQMH